MSPCSSGYCSFVLVKAAPSTHHQAQVTHACSNTDKEQTRRPNTLPSMTINYEPTTNSTMCIPTVCVTMLVVNPQSRMLPSLLFKANNKHNCVETVASCYVPRQTNFCRLVLALANTYHVNKPPGAFFWPSRVVPMCSLQQQHLTCVHP